MGTVVFPAVFKMTLAIIMTILSVVDLDLSFI
ncbi:hypothetical protein NMY3_02013 [Candidatus Nitrosocosmicus oleophilus]|uniref:Uncharacterized protein n=1 Tax=Candidatus Nitrosocosmicus oleophilus TaxID=1353260 RepID=A0A654LYB6_9ARCH|nr:hypothetical protein NMY3_02013 [Candidatus Nitrosocosmicus oleophilus]